MWCITALELEARTSKAHHEKVEVVTQAMDRTHTLFVEAYHDLGAEIAPFDKLGGELGTRLLSWLQEKLASLPSIATGLMSYASLVPLSHVKPAQMPFLARAATTSRYSIGATRILIGRFSRSVTQL